MPISGMGRVIFTRRSKFSRINAEVENLPSYECNGLLQSKLPVMKTHFDFGLPYFELNFGQKTPERSDLELVVHSTFTT